MHKAQQQFCETVKELFPEYFTNKKVIDFGSLDINGNNRYLFENCQYTGVDIAPGNNVDVVSRCHLYKPAARPDVIISTEMLEHDEHYGASIRHMIDILKPGGLLIITCATTGRREHGTRNSDPIASPFTPDYYHNITRDEFEQIANKFKDFYIHRIFIRDSDLQFYGLKNDA